MLAVLLIPACVATLPEMSPYSEIQKKPGFLGKSYEQNGHSIDRSDMLEKLDREPVASEALSGYGALAPISWVLAAAGGGLIGWPLGVAAAGGDNPPWAAAGVGAATLVVGLVLAAIADNKVESAVDAHNDRFGFSKNGQPRQEAGIAASASGTPHTLKPIREVVDLAGEVRLELFGYVPQFGSKVGLRFSRVVPPAGLGFANCSTGTVRIDDVDHALPSLTINREQAGAELRESAQTHLPFDEFERLTEADNVQFVVCGLTPTLTSATLVPAKRFRQRFRQQLQTVTSSGATVSSGPAPTANVQGSPTAQTSVESSVQRP
jgi:hypothetical protein